MQLNPATHEERTQGAKPLRPFFLHIVRKGKRKYKNPQGNKRTNKGERKATRPTKDKRTRKRIRKMKKKGKYAVSLLSA